MASDAPMNRERCLFLLSLEMDGREVEADELARARAFAEQDEECHKALATWTVVREVLASEPALRASDGFTGRVLAMARSRADVVPFARRLALAAGLALALTVGYGAARPGALHAGDAIEAQRHHVDAFRTDAFTPDDLQAGLAQLLPFRPRGERRP